MISKELAEELGNYFRGKICSVMTSQMSLPMNKQDFKTWFTVVVDDITEEAIVGTDLKGKTKSVFFFPVIGIAEEEVVTEDSPKYEIIKEKVSEIAKIKHEEIATKKPKEEGMKIPESAVAKLSKQVSQVKKQWTTGTTPNATEGKNYELPILFNGN